MRIMQDGLLDRTKTLLRECELSLPEIATRSKLGYEWLKKFAADDIPDPGVKRIQQLHDFLVSHQCAPKHTTARDSAPA